MSDHHLPIALLLENLWCHC